MIPLKKPGIVTTYSMRGWQVAFVDPIMRQIDKPHLLRGKRRQRDAIRLHKRVQRAIISGDIKTRWGKL